MNVAPASHTPPTRDVATNAAVSNAPQSRGVRAIVETTKPRITRLVTMTTGVGFAVTLLSQGRDAVTLDAVWKGLACVVGTALCAAGANSWNQFMERSRDARMPRTRNRPLPTGRATPRSVLATSALACAIGLGVLTVFCGWPAMLLSLACIVSYLVMYTPLKPITPLATFIGAIPGALPPMIGAAAATTRPGAASMLEPVGIALFTLMMVWQLPHFLAIAWMYRDDYAKGGYAVLPVVDPSGGLTSWTVALWSLALVPATIVPAIAAPSVLGLPYKLLALVLGALFCALAFKLVQDRTRSSARILFFASIIHLPLLLIALVTESLARTFL